MRIDLFLKSFFPILIISNIISFSCVTGGGNNVPVTPSDSGGDADPPVHLAAFTDGWKTDWSRHSVPFSDIAPGCLAKDCFVSVDDPQFTSILDSGSWLEEGNPVVVVEVNGTARAYPLAILVFHEIINDYIGGVPVAVTFCTVCGSSVVYERSIDGVVHEFGVSGLFRKLDMIMYDRITDSLWQQITGDCLVGKYSGRKLKMVRSSISSLADFTLAYPQGKVLDKPNPKNPYSFVPYFNQSDPLAPPPNSESDSRLPGFERVVGVEINGVSKAYDFTTIIEQGIIHDTVGGMDLVVFHTFPPETTPILYPPVTGEPTDPLPMVGIFVPELSGLDLTFRFEDNSIYDMQTNSTWNALGHAVDGPFAQAGYSLQPVLHVSNFWFAWRTFHPDTEIYVP